VYAAALAASRRGQISTPFAANPQCRGTTTVFCNQPVAVFGLFGQEIKLLT
jgi:hypothetical protein